MTNRTSYILKSYILLVCCLLTTCWQTSCQRTAPQRPTVHGRAQTVQADSATMQLLCFNQQMTDAADRELTTWVQQDSIHTWAQREDGVWIRRDNIFALAEHSLYENGQTIQLHMQIRRLDGTMVIDTQENHTLGSNRLPMGIENVLREMVPGSCCTIVVPWYAGYGVQGNDIIGKYENILVQIEL